MKVDVERFGCNNLFQDFKVMKNDVKIAMNVWWMCNEITGVFSIAVLTAFFMNLKSYIYIYIYIYSIQFFILGDCSMQSFQDVGHCLISVGPIRWVSLRLVDPKPSMNLVTECHWGDGLLRLKDLLTDMSDYCWFIHWFIFDESLCFHSRNKTKLRKNFLLPNFMSLHEDFASLYRTNK